MDTIALYVGLDYHQSKVQVCAVDQGGRMIGNQACANDWKTIVRQVERWGTVRRAALESCSGAADLADELVERAGWTVDLAHAGYVARIKQSPDKSDFSDAHLLADLERVGYLPCVWLAPREVRELRMLVRYRQQRVRARRATKQRMGAVLREERVFRPPGMQAWSRPWLSWLMATAPLSKTARWVISEHLTELRHLHDKLNKIHARLREVTKNDVLVQRLVAQPGIGPVTAWTLRAEIGRFDRFRKARQLPRHCGLSPRNAASGAREATAGLIKAANGDLRSILIEAAHRLIRYQPRWTALADKLRAAGKPGSLIAAAVANRWLRWLYYQMQPQSI